MRLAWPIVLAATLAPILAAPVLPLLDAHSHIARVVALRRLLVTGEGSAFYELDRLLLPNMGFDAVGLVLSAWFSPAAIGRVFVAGTLVLTLGGVAALHRRLSGQWSALPLAGALLLYNLFTLLGLIGYGLGVGLLFWALAARLGLTGWRAVAPGAAFGVVLLLCHVSVFGIYAVMLVSVIAHGVWTRQLGGATAALTALELAPAAALFLALSGGGGPTFYDPPFWRAKLFGGVETLTSGDMVADAALAAGLVAIGIALAWCRPRLDPRFVPGLVGLLLLYVLLPAHLNGGSYVDLRLPVVILWLALAALRVHPRSPPSRRMVVCIGLAVLALAVKQAALTAQWHRHGQALAQLAAAFERLPEGAVIFQSECHPDADDILAIYRSRQPPLPHVASLAAFGGTRLAAVGWTLPGQQPIRIAPTYAALKRYQDGLDNHTCTTAEYRAVLDGLRAVLATEVAAGRAVPPAYLLLLRPDRPGLLSGNAPLVLRMTDVELYAASPGSPRVP